MCAVVSLNENKEIEKLPEASKARVRQTTTTTTDGLDHIMGFCLG